ncbi:hypothetical protein [Streptomyces sp. NPDC090029]|uniref:hypothetical protein n=1 Tax=Streptomyces sp. NPDC090029 TaxID=3365924 RepID=UPI0037F8ECF2
MGARGRKETRGAADPGAGPVIASFASLGAAAVHVAAAPDHFAEWWAAGVFFYAVGAFQALWAVAVLRFPRPALMAAGLVANVGVVAVWALSRTAGMPVGPGAGVPEEVTGADAATVAFEAVVVLVAALGPRRSASRGFASPFTAVAVAGAAGALVTGLTVPAVQSALSHSHGHGPADGSTPHGHSEEDGHGAGSPEQPDAHSSRAPGDGSAHNGAPASATPAPRDADAPAGEATGSGQSHDDEPHGH